MCYCKYWIQPNPKGNKNQISLVIVELLPYWWEPPTFILISHTVGAFIYHEFEIAELDSIKDNATFHVYTCAWRDLT